jgi:hypothetical protein
LENRVEVGGNSKTGLERSTAAGGRLRIDPDGRMYDIEVNPKNETAS